MLTSISRLLGAAATAYGVLAALSMLLQARQMHARGTSCEVSARFFASYAGGYAIWLLYGLSAGNVPLIVVDAVGLLCAGLTLVVALSLRGSLVHPASWASRPRFPAQGKVRSPPQRRSAGGGWRLRPGGGAPGRSCRGGHGRGGSGDGGEVLDKAAAPGGGPGPGHLVGVEVACRGVC